MIIYKIPAINNEPTASLVLINGVNLCDSTLNDLKNLEVSEKAQIRYVISPGDWHWVSLYEYNVVFPNATIYIPPGRIVDQHPVNLTYTLIDVDNPLPQLKPYVQVILMKGLRQPLPHWGTVRYEFLFFHSVSGTLVAGDIMFWYI